MKEQGHKTAQLLKNIKSLEKRVEDLETTLLKIFKEEGGLSSVLSNRIETLSAAVQFMMYENSSRDGEGIGIGILN